MHCLSALWVTLWHTIRLFCLCYARGEEPLLSVHDSLRVAVVVMSPCWKYANCLCVLVPCSSPWQVTMVPSVALPEQSLSVSAGPAQSLSVQTVHTLQQSQIPSDKIQNHIDKNIPALICTHTHYTDIHLCANKLVLWWINTKWDSETLSSLHAINQWIIHHKISMLLVASKSTILMPIQIHVYSDPYHPLII